MLNPETSLNSRPVDRLAKSPILAAAADAWQPVVAAALKRLDPRLLDALHGTPLGHPFHPLITDVPVGAWTVTAVLDALELAGRGNAAGADAALAIGVGGATLAALSGWADWSDTDGDPKRLGIAHAGLNAAALTAYAASLALRRAGRRPAGIALAMLGYGFLSAAGFLGGELSFGRQLGVKHTAEPLDAPADFVSVLDATALADGSMKRVEANGVPVLLYRDGESIHAIAAVCTHRGAPLDDGKIEDGCVECPWHGSVFSLAHGAVVRGPASFPIAHYEARVRAGKIEVRIAS